MLHKKDTSLLQFSQLSQLQAPKRDRLRTLQNWLERPGYGNAFLQGVEARAWDAESTGLHDFVSLRDRRAGEEDDSSDPATRWLYRFISGAYHNLVGHRLKQGNSGSNSAMISGNGPANTGMGGSSTGIASNQNSTSASAPTYTYDDTLLHTIIRISSTILSSLLPTVSIFALYYTRNNTLRLVLVLIFTSLFTLVLSIFTGAKRIEIFAATAA